MNIKMPILLARDTAGLIAQSGSQDTKIVHGKVSYTELCGQITYHTEYSLILTQPNL